MAKSKLGKERLVICRISSSISNFRNKLLKRYGLPEWHWLKDRNKECVFFGMYHIGDYLRLFWHRGDKTVVWCGGDILSLQNRKLWARWVAKVKAKHFCENDVEKAALVSLGIKTTVKPMLFDPNFPLNIAFEPSNTPHVFVCSHPGYNEEYGVNMIEGISAVVPNVTFHIYGVYGISHDNIIYHGEVPDSVFNDDIKNYQAGLRLNDFDGFSEVLAKSILMGQYPISTIYYPMIDYASTTTKLINFLKDLKNKKKPNIEGRKFWLNELNKNPFI